MAKLKRYKQAELLAMSEEEVWALPFVIPQVHNLDELPVTDPLKIPLLQSGKDGDLKELLRPNAVKLKIQLMVKGYTSPFIVFKLPNGREYLGDGNGRRKLFEQQQPLDRYGEPLTEFPYLRLPAKSKRDAAEQLAALTSQYHTITEEGRDWFVETFDLPAFDQVFQFDALPMAARGINGKGDKKEGGGREL